MFHGTPPVIFIVVFFPAFHVSVSRFYVLSAGVTHSHWPVHFSHTPPASDADEHFINSVQRSNHWASTSRWPDYGLTCGQRLRWLPSIWPSLGQRILHLLPPNMSCYCRTTTIVDYTSTSPAKVNSSTQHTWDVGPTLVYCWANVVDGEPTVNQRWANFSCLQGKCLLEKKTHIEIRWSRICIRKIQVGLAGLEPGMPAWLAW